MSEKCHCGLCVHLGQPLLERLRGHVGTAWVNEDEAAREIERLQDELSALRHQLASARRQALGVLAQVEQDRKEARQVESEMGDE